jgi:hypothetical protein
VTAEESIMSDRRDPAAITRREAVRRGAAGALGLSLAGRLGLPAFAAERQARAVIQIWMWGGPCHLDTFDPKPDAGYDFCGPLDQATSTNVSGIRVGSMLPELAKQADKYSIIRSMTHGSNAHETASYLVQTGREPGRQVYPCLGAIVSRLKGYEAGYDGAIPPYVVLTQPQGRFSEAGFLGPRYEPFATGGDPNRDPFAVEGVILDGISDRRQRNRRELLHALDSLGAAMQTSPHFELLDTCEEKAYELMFGEAREIFDLSKEGEKERERYGRTTFGQSCLMARRLVEHGVPWVTINYQGWDTHKQHFQIMNRRLPEMDQAMAVLLADLADRGLLESTIVWWSGEFGRTPRVQWEPPWNGGRGHFGQCFSAVVAGGGFEGGSVVGASDATGEEVVDRPVHPSDLLASFCQLLGIDPEAPLPNQRGLEVAVMPPASGSDGPLTEIMKRGRAT